MGIHTEGALVVDTASSHLASGPTHPKSKPPTYRHVVERKAGNIADILVITFFRTLTLTPTPPEVLLVGGGAKDSDQPAAPSTLCWQMGFQLPRSPESPPPPSIALSTGIGKRIKKALWR